jgi:hypothetical protein
MSLRAKLGMFVLTRQEQRTIAFIVLALTLGLATQHYRHTHSKPSRAPEEDPISAAVSPSPARIAKPSNIR